MTDKIVDETVVQLPPKVTVGFAKKINPQQRKGLPQYENEEAQVFIEATFSTPTPNETEVEDAIKGAYAIAKAAVFDQLGVDYDYDPAQQAVVEKLQDTFPGTTVEHTGGIKKTTTTYPKKSPAKSPNPEDKTPYWEQLQTELTAGPDEKGHFPSYWDNRQTKTGRQPDFKVRNTKAARDAGLEPDVALWVSSAPEGFKEVF